MKPAPRNVFLGFLLMGLVALEFLVGGPGSKGTRHAPRTALLDGFEIEAVASIHVMRGAQEVHLDRRDERWVVRERRRFRANELLIETLLRPLAGLSRSDVVASESESHGLFGLDEGATHIALRDAEGFEFFAFRLGRPEEEVAGSYLAFPAAPEVYRAATLALPRPEPERWLHPFLVDLDLADVEGIHAQWRDGTSFHLRLSENGRWDAVGRSRSLVPARVHALLTLCANLVLSEVIEEEFGRAGLDPPLLLLRFDLEGGVRRIALGDVFEDGGGRAATSADWPSAWVVRLTETSARRLESLVRRIQMEIEKTSR